MIEIYLDTADVEQVARFNVCLPLAGVTTNPSILAKSNIGLNQLLPALAVVLDSNARFHVQVVSQTVEGMLAEAIQLSQLPFNVVVKVAATETGLAAIKRMKAEAIPVLATAVYSAHQGFLAALCGADYLAPYVNRIDALGIDGVSVVADLQQLLENHQLQSKILAASFKSTRQAMDVMKLGIAAITLPVEIVQQMLADASVLAAVEQFDHDWQAVFGSKLSFES